MAAALKDELQRERVALCLLIRSNDELRIALAESMDPEFRQAIEENIVVIAKKRARVSSLEEEISRIESGAGVSPGTSKFEPHATSAGTDDVARHTEETLHLPSIGQPSGLNMDCTTQRDDHNAAVMEELHPERDASKDGVWL